MTAPITSYNRVAPPSDPASSRFHLDGELTKLEQSTASLITALGAIPDTYATVVDLEAEETARIAEDSLKASIVYVDAQDGIESAARIAADALKASIIYVDAQDAVESAARIAADALLAPLASPALTGNPTAPTQTSGDNSTKLATTAYVDALPKWEYIGKSADQTITASTTLTDDTELQFAMAANTTYLIRICMTMSYTTGGWAFGISGPASPTRVRSYNAFTAYGLIGAGGATGALIDFFVVKVENGANAGNFKLQFAESVATGSVVMEKGSYLEYRAL